jgi:hypothetical protein
MFLIPVGLLLAVAAPPPEPQSQAGGRELRVEWAAEIGPAAPRIIYRVAVCSDGTSFLTLHEGRLVALDAAGAVVSDGAYKELEGTSATACSTSNVLHAATMAGDLVRVDLRPAGQPAFQSNHTGLVTRSMVARGDGTFLAFGWNGREGMALYPVAPTAGAGPSFGGKAIEGIRDGFVVVDGDRVTLVPTEQYEFLNFRGSGEFLERRASGDAEFQPETLDKERVWHGGSVMGAFTLPGGDLAVHVVKQPPARGLDGQSTVDVHSAAKQQMLFRVPNPYGVLTGVDGSGALYFFQAGVASPIKITKARIVEAAATGDKPPVGALAATPR